MTFFKNMKQNFPKDRPTRIILGAMVLLGLVGAFFGFRMVRHVVATNQTFSLPGDPVIRMEPGSLTNGEDDGNGSAAEVITAASLPSPEPWDGISRVNFLLLGLDYRDWEAGDIPRTDTMILLTL
jgi:polyisoprenyl-teichoic acid--peptidoglycan teichoic acid transferase